MADNKLGKQVTNKTRNGLFAWAAVIGIAAALLGPMFLMISAIDRQLGEHKQFYAHPRAAATIEVLATQFAEIETQLRALCVATDIRLKMLEKPTSSEIEGVCGALKP